MSTTTRHRAYLSIKQAAEFTGFSVFTIRDKIDAGELPAYRISEKPGSAIRVKIADVEALMKPVLPVAIQAAR